MLQTRHEEYGQLSNQHPCIFTKAFERTASICSQQSNWHENLEIQVCVSGAGYVLLDGIRHEIKEKDIIVINSNVVHYTGTDSQLTYSCLIIDSKFCRQAALPHTQLCFEPLFQSETILQLFQEIHQIQSNPDDLCGPARLQVALLRILIELRQNHTLSEQISLPPNQAFDNVRQTICYIREHYSNKLTLDVIARNAMTDKYSLSRNFKLLTGQTIVQYLNNYRCERAVEMIRDGVPVNETAVLCGFHNMSFFTKTFRQYTGKLPSSYKKM